MTDQERGSSSNSEKELAAIEREIQKGVTKHQAQNEVLKDLPSPTKTPTSGK